jgi:hypothetical protein
MLYLEKYIMYSFTPNIACYLLMYLFLACTHVGSTESHTRVESISFIDSISRLGVARVESPTLSLIIDMSQRCSLELTAGRSLVSHDMRPASSAPRSWPFPSRQSYPRHW